MTVAGVVLELVLIRSGPVEPEYVALMVCGPKVLGVKVTEQLFGVTPVVVGKAQAPLSEKVPAPDARAKRTLPCGVAVELTVAVQVLGFPTWTDGVQVTVVVLAAPPSTTIPPVLRSSLKKVVQGIPLPGMQSFVEEVNCVEAPVAP